MYYYYQLSYARKRPSVKYHCFYYVSLIITFIVILGMCVCNVKHLFVLNMYITFHILKCRFISLIPEHFSKPQMKYSWYMINRQCLGYEMLFFQQTNIISKGIFTQNTYSFGLHLQAMLHMRLLYCCDAQVTISIYYLTSREMTRESPTSRPGKYGCKMFSLSCK